MSIPFSRSLRSIQMDSTSWSITGLTLSLLLLGSWMLWFFVSPVSIYEISKDVSVNEQGKIVAKFSPKALERMESGQNASIRVEFKASSASSSNGGKTIPKIMTFAGIVMKLPMMEVDENGKVELSALDDEFYYLLQNNDLQGMKVEVEVEVERVTPFVLLQRAARELTTSSQSNTLPLNSTQ